MKLIFYQVQVRVQVHKLELGTVHNGTMSSLNKTETARTEAEPAQIETETEQTEAQTELNHFLIAFIC